MDDSEARTAIEERKRAHIDLCLNEDVSSRENWWDQIRFTHSSLPEISKDHIDVSSSLLGVSLAAPLVISGMTGGCESGAEINGRLAEAAAKVGVAFGVGSQRPALEDPSWAWTYELVRDHDIPLILANVGVPQLLVQHDRAGWGIEEIRTAIDMVGADAVCLHLNYLQEIVQPEGDHNAKGALKAITEVANEVPVVAKETGAGIRPSDIVRLRDAGVSGIDVGGLSGTSWSAVEHYRALKSGDGHRARLGALFWDWGIPTAACIAAAPIKSPDLISTGGMRTGLDLARAIALGATAAGFARRLLPAADTSVDAVVDELEGVIDELRSTMFLLGCTTISDLQNIQPLVTGDLREWITYLRGEEYGST